MFLFNSLCGENEEIEPFKYFDANSLSESVMNWKNADDEIHLVFSKFFFVTLFNKFTKM